MVRKMGKKGNFSINALLKQSGYSEKAIKEILKFYGQNKTKK
jgi:predicted Ser/Thr protein kinase